MLTASPDTGYHGGVLHLTADASASATFNFTGSHIYYYSDFNVDHGQYSVAVDDGAPKVLSSLSSTLQPVQALFDEALQAGPHTIKLQNLENKTMALDFFMCVSEMRARKAEG